MIVGRWHAAANTLQLMPSLALRFLKADLPLFDTRRTMQGFRE
jgi:hypothetical protein